MAATTAPRRRLLLPAALGAMGVLLAVKVATLAAAPPGAGAGGAAGLVASANASEPKAAPASTPAPPPPARSDGAPAAACGPEQPQTTPEQRAERELLQALRARRAELDAREQALLTREVVAEATERRAAQRLEELSALQRGTAAAAAAAESERERSERERERERERAEREEAGWRQMVKLYEGMRPRDAAAIFDDLELPVLVPLVDRLRENKAAPILGAMRPDRARALTAELARHRAARGARG